MVVYNLNPFKPFVKQLNIDINSLIANNNIRSVILEIKTTYIKSLKYFVLFPENIFKVNRVLKS